MLTTDSVTDDVVPSLPLTRPVDPRRSHVVYFPHLDSLTSPCSLPFNSIGADGVRHLAEGMKGQRLNCRHFRKFSCLLLIHCRSAAISAWWDPLRWSCLSRLMMSPWVRMCCL